MSEEFRVLVRDETFVLDKHQILFDSPNYFRSYFLGGFKEAAEGQRQLTLRRDPFLFRIIENYLSGYSVIPLPPNLPPHLSQETAMANLLRDAQFYGLDGLVRLLEASSLAVENEYKVVEYEYRIYTLLTQGYGDRWHLLEVSQEGLQFHLEWLKTNKDAFPFPLLDFPREEDGWTIYGGFRVKAPISVSGTSWTYHRLDYAVFQRAKP